MSVDDHGRDDEDTVDDLLAVSANDPIEVTSVIEDAVEISAVTHRGRVRKNNEDQFAVVRRTRSGKVLASSIPTDDLATTIELPGCFALQTDWEVRFRRRLPQQRSRRF